MCIRDSYYVGAKGPEDIMGCGNCVISIYSPEKKDQVEALLYCMDSNDYQPCLLYTSPSLVICQMKMEFIQFIECHQIKKLQHFLFGQKFLDLMADVYKRQVIAISFPVTSDFVVFNQRNMEKGQSRNGITTVLLCKVDVYKRQVPGTS